MKQKSLLISLFTFFIFAAITFAQSDFDCSDIPVPVNLTLSYSRKLPTLQCNFSIPRQPDSSRTEQSGIFATVEDVDLAIIHVEVTESGSPNPKVIRSYRDGKQLDEDAPMGNDGIFTYQGAGRTLEFVTDRYIVEITGAVEFNYAKEKYHPWKNGYFGDEHPGFDHAQTARMKEGLLEIGKNIMDALAGKKVEPKTPAQPAEEPRVEIPPPEQAESENYSQYRQRIDETINEILGSVMLPVVPENITRGECSLLCSRAYYSDLTSACKANKTKLDKVDPYASLYCQVSIDDRVENCFTDVCHFTRGLGSVPFPYENMVRDAILVGDAAEKLFGQDMQNELNRRLSVDPRINITTSVESEQLLRKLDELRGSTMHSNTKNQIVSPGGSLIIIEPQSSVKFIQPAESAEDIRELRIMLGEVEIETNGPEKFKIHLPQGEVTNEETHFWVRVTKEGDSLIGVYDGSVFVKSLVTGEEKTIVPDGANPGIALLRFFTSDELGITTTNEQKSVWLWLIIFATISGIGYFAYRTFFKK